jgi:Mrp family chromosome partitioning ATPase
MNMLATTTAAAAPASGLAPDRHQPEHPTVSAPSADRAHRAPPALADGMWQDEWDHIRMVRQNATNEAGFTVDRDRDHPASRAFDVLRTRLVRTLELKGWNRIAVSAPTSGCGSTFTAVNLALSLSRVPDSRTVLVDLDQRAPGVAQMLGVGGTHVLGDYLHGRTETRDHMVRLSETLALALNSEVNINAAEQLHDSGTGQVLETMQDALDPDIVLYDMPAMLEHDDLAAFLPNVDGVLLVSDGTRSTKKQIEECERILDGQTRLLGVVLNKGRI